MEDVLDVYERPYDPKRPVVCMDEQPDQLIGEERIAIPAEPGQPERYDYQYVRNGTVANFMFFEPLGNFRRVSVRERKTQLDFAEEIAYMLDVDYPDAEVVVLVMDNFSIPGIERAHKIGSLYEKFPPEKARAYARRLEIHYTPKHGSWLDAAEIELSILYRSCFRFRLFSRRDESCRRAVCAARHGTFFDNEKSPCTPRQSPRTFRNTYCEVTSS